MSGDFSSNCRKIVWQVRAADPCSYRNGFRYVIIIPVFIFGQRNINWIFIRGNDTLWNRFRIVFTAEYECNHGFRSAEGHISRFSGSCNNAYGWPGNEYGNTDIGVCICNGWRSYYSAVLSSIDSKLSDNMHYLCGIVHSFRFCFICWNQIW